MRIKITTLIVLFIITQSISALKKSTDTIKIKTPVYFSSLERSNFENYLQTKEIDILSMSLCLDSTITNEKQKENAESVDKFLKSIETEISRISNEKRKIKFIFEKAHKQFFRKYDSDADFNKLFVNGNYNCVTGSLFFSTILTKLKIPFTIKEKPTHVFILAYPITFSIPIESTDPGMKFYIPDENFKKRYVNNLVDNKLITLSEINEKGVESIFNSNYYSNKDISTIELAGLQYFNSAILYGDIKDYKKAFQQLEKAYLLNPSERIRYSMELALGEIIDGTSFISLDQVNYISKLESYLKGKSYNDQILGRFYNTTNKYLVNENNELHYEKIYNNLITQLEDTTLKKEISNNYYYERARICTIRGDFTKGWELITTGYNSNPGNMNTIALLQDIFIHVLKKQLGNDNFIEFLTKSLSDYPILVKNQDIVNIGCAYYLQKAYNYFRFDNKEKGNKALLEFENFINKYNCKPDNVFVGVAYSEAASHYYRARDLKNCKLVLERGMKISPNNDELIKKYKLDITKEIK